jgi:uncharacterized protein (TIGR02271 family)
MFDNRSEAEAARQRLSQSSIDAGRVQILDQSQAGHGATEGNGTGNGGFWSSVKDAFLPSDDRSAYEEGVRRGGCVLCAQVEENQADEAIRILEETGSVDFDARQEQWRQEGWTGGASQREQGQNAQAQFAQGQRTQEQGRVAEERIPIVEEELRVGKREVERGGARVRSYVQETPVTEQVNLRDEHVSVERRAVNQPVSAADLERGDFLQNREIEMTETAEEAVVGKEARVREEVVVRKEATERTETVQDSVRHTEVEVDRTGSEHRPAMGFSRNAQGASDTQRADREQFERGDTSRR